MTDIAQLTAERDALKAELESARVGAAFQGSKFVAERLTMPPDIVAAKFGRSFTFEDGRLVGKDAQGRAIMSQQRMGEPADFDEALETLLKDYPDRARIMKAGGSRTGDWTPAARPSLRRAAFDALSPDQRTTFIRAGGVLRD